MVGSEELVNILSFVRVLWNHQSSMFTQTWSYLFEKSLEKILYLWTQQEKQSEPRKRVVVVPWWTRDPSATVSDGGQKRRPANEIKQRESILLPISNVCLKSKIYFRAFSSVMLPSCSLNLSTAGDVEQGLGRLKSVHVETLCFICCETTNV